MPVYSRRLGWLNLLYILSLYVAWGIVLADEVHALSAGAHAKLRRVARGDGASELLCRLPDDLGEVAIVFAERVGRVVVVIALGIPSVEELLSRHGRIRCAGRQVLAVGTLGMSIDAVRCVRGRVVGQGMVPGEFGSRMKGALGVVVGQQ